MSKKARSQIHSRESTSAILSPTKCRKVSETGALTIPEASPVIRCISSQFNLVSGWITISDGQLTLPINSLHESDAVI